MSYFWIAFALNVLLIVAIAHAWEPGDIEGPLKFWIGIIFIGPLYSLFSLPVMYGLVWAIGTAFFGGASNTGDIGQ